MVQFDYEEDGLEMQKKHPLISKRFPACTPIQRVMLPYTFTKRCVGSISNVAHLYQFQLLFASPVLRISSREILSLNL